MSIRAGAKMGVEIDTKNLPLHPEEALLVLGSLHANPQDRELERSEVRPVQVVDRSGVRPVSFFDSWGEFGVSSLAWRPGNPLVLYVTTGSDLVKLDLSEESVTELGVPKLRSVHEVTAVEDTLWLANTRFDEVVAFDLAEERIASRLGFTAPDSALDAEAHGALPEAGEDAEQVVKKFHCNQVFEGFDGELYGLVHHVSGKQLVRRVAQKLIKNHGNGGLISLRDGRGVPLKLKGPHTVRKVRGEYWVFDSGRHTVNVYDQGWSLRRTLCTSGWGRGASVSESLGVFYAGVSQMRRRYSGARKSREDVPNMVLAFSMQTGEPLGGTVLSGIEQVNNVYTVSAEVARALLDLGAGPPTASGLVDGRGEEVGDV
jgi:hypothetical protein